MGATTMTLPATPSYRLLLRVALIFMAVGPVATGNGTKTPEDADFDAEQRTAFKDTGRASPSADDRQAEERYREKAAEIALRTDKTAASSRENAAPLYYQALLAYREPDPCTARVLNALSRGGEPDRRIRAYLGRSLNTIEIAQVAAQMPQCHWGPMRAGGQQLDFNLGIPLRQLGRLLDADARTLAADGHTRAALARCLTLRRLAHHASDETYNLYSISQSLHTLALLAVTQVLSTRTADRETLTWLKAQLAATPGTPFRPAQALQKWREAELQFWRTRPQGRPFTRDMVLEKIPDANDRVLLGVLTDEQLLVIALQRERLVPGYYGISAEPQLLTRAQQACDEYLASALQMMKANLPYREIHAKLQEMVEALDDRAADGDPIALLSEAPKVVEIYHRLMVRNAVYDNLVAAAIEVRLVKARHGPTAARDAEGPAQGPLHGQGPRI